MEKYIILDESGSYWNNQERYFVIAGYIADDLTKIVALHRNCEKAIKMLRNIPIKQPIELKASKLLAGEKAYFIKDLLSQENVRGVAVVIDKKNSTISVGQNEIYNYLIKLLFDSLTTNDVSGVFTAENIHFRLDNRSIKVSLIHQLEEYLNSEFPFCNIKVMYLDSAHNREIQMADYIANMIFTRYNYPKNSKLMNYLKNIPNIWTVKFPYSSFGK